MGGETMYSLVSGNGYTLVTGAASEVVSYITQNDKSISNLRLAKKPKEYWKDGLSVKAMKV